jgi:hypothetical protein
MNWIQSLLLGTALTGMAALAGYWIACQTASRERFHSARGFLPWFEEQMTAPNPILSLLGLLGMIIPLAFTLGAVLALWPSQDVALYWLAVTCSPLGYALSFFQMRYGARPPTIQLGAALSLVFDRPRCMDRHYHELRRLCVGISSAAVIRFGRVVSVTPSAFVQDSSIPSH